MPGRIRKRFPPLRRRQPVDLEVTAAVGEPVRIPASLDQCMQAHRGWRYADAIGARYTMYNKLTRQTARVVEVQCVEEQRQGVPTS
jgi:hypothetical protein